MIQEHEFPHLFKNPVVQQQKMSKYLDEQDFNSDSETIEHNKGDLLKQLSQSIDRFAKTDPTKFIENLKAPNADTDPVLLENNLLKIRQQALEPLNSKLTPDTAVTSNRKSLRSQNKSGSISKKNQVQLSIVTEQECLEPVNESDTKMQSPKIGLDLELLMASPKAVVLG